MDFDKSILRSADIRGIYPERITGEFAKRLGEVFGSYIKRLGKLYCVVGHDNRHGGHHLTKMLVEGLLSTGIDVIYVGLVTTPMFNFASRKVGLEYGIMVTASHNPKNDNGFKLFGKNYQHCNEEELDIIYKGLSDSKFELEYGKGQIEPIDVVESYAKYMAESINPGKRPMKVVVDAGNGTSSIILKKVYERLPFEVIYLYCESDPNFPNHHPDPNVKENLKKLARAVRYNKCDLGIAYDGDCDRAGFVDHKGNVVDADVIMALLCKDILKHSSNKIVSVDVKSSKVLEDEILKHNGVVYYETSSSARQERVMEEKDIPFGGGYSNHIFFRDRHPGYDDGIYIGLRVQEMLEKEGKSLFDLTKRLKLYHNTEEIKMHMPDSKKFKIVDGIKRYCDEHKYKYTTVDGLKITKDKGWALIRASNTGPNLTLRFEATTESELKKLEEEFISILEILKR